MSSDEGTFEGYLVLSAHSQVMGVPLVSTPRRHSQHLAGRYAGSLYANSERDTEVFLPQRNRDYTLLLTRSEEGPLTEALMEAESTDGGPYEDKLAAAIQARMNDQRYLCAIEAVGPGPFIAFCVRNYSLYFWGASSDNAEILLWSTVPTLGDQMYPNWWVVSLGALTSHVKVLHTQRIVQRWMRWRNNGMPSSCQRFLAMWRNLMGIPDGR